MMAGVSRSMSLSGVMIAKSSFSISASTSSNISSESTWSSFEESSSVRDWSRSLAMSSSTSRLYAGIVRGAVLNGLLWVEFGLREGVVFERRGGGGGGGEAGRQEVDE